MLRIQVYTWKRMPFLRYLLPFIAGILLQFYFPFSIVYILTIAAITTGLYIGYALLPQSIKFVYGWLHGIIVHVLLIALGGLIVYHANIQHQSNWIGNIYRDSAAVLVALREPLIEKEKSYKALAAIQAVQVNGAWHNVQGNVLVYFKKDSVPPALFYGTQILLYKPLQLIKNSGNPGAFDYRQYNALQDIYHQVFLKEGEYFITTSRAGNVKEEWLLSLRQKVITILQTYIHGSREAGVAEALLIGYRNDLDKDLVQAYSNTGVVHIIAISGLHLGMIYVVLLTLFKPFKKYRITLWIKPVVILTVLWIFSLLAGGVPSIVRSAVMFTFIVVGEMISRKTSMYNTLAASAFVMLCYNPYYLWDVGFQLSYAAVISIVTFMQPIYNLLYVPNKALNFFWKLSAITLAAQLLTSPIIFYHFHQFPLLFLVTNFVAVPLSSIILFGELLLLIAAYVPVAANIVGQAVSGLLYAMNSFIAAMDKLPFAVYDHIQFSILQTWLLVAIICAAAYWLMWKYKPALFASLIFMLLFAFTDAYDRVTQHAQAIVIIYNVPQHRAIDFVEGKQHQFVGDPVMMEDGFLRNFHLKPARTFYGMYQQAALQNLYTTLPFIYFKGKKILLIDRAYRFAIPGKIKVDLIAISKNAKVDIDQLASVFDCSQYVFDGSNSLWKMKQWKSDCERLHLPHYYTGDAGAFVLQL